MCSTTRNLGYTQALGMVVITAILDRALYRAPELDRALAAVSLQTDKVTR